MVIIDYPSELYVDERRHPEGKFDETPLKNLGHHAVLRDSEGGVQVLAVSGKRFVQVALMKLPNSDPAEAKRTVIALTRVALSAEWTAR